VARVKPQPDEDPIHRLRDHRPVWDLPPVPTSAPRVGAEVTQGQSNGAWPVHPIL